MNTSLLGELAQAAARDLEPGESVEIERRHGGYSRLRVCKLTGDREKRRAILVAQATGVLTQDEADRKLASCITELSLETVVSDMDIETSICGARKPIEALLIELRTRAKAAND